MAMSEDTRKYIDGQIDYYISEAGSYRQMAEAYRPEVGSVADAAFGIVAGCIHAAFLQVCQGRQQGPSLVEVQELGRMLKERAPLIKRAIMESGGADAAAPARARE